MTGVQTCALPILGVDEEFIYQQAVKLLTDTDEYNKMARAVNPYGDGHASERIVRHILNWKME